MTGTDKILPAVAPLLAESGSQVRAIAALLAAVKEGRTPALASNAPRLARLHLCAALRGAGIKRLLFVAADDREARDAARELRAAVGGEVCLFPARELALFDAEGRSREWEHIRIGALSRALSGDVAVVATAEALMQPTCPADIFAASSITLEAGREYPQQELLGRLAAAGYSRSDMVEGPGQFARRGFIFDVFAPGAPSPWRIEFFGDEIDALAPFDVSTQRRGEGVERIVIPPARESVGDEKSLAALRRAIKSAASSARRPELKERLARDLDELEHGGSVTAPDRFSAVRWERGGFLTDYMEGAAVILSEPRQTADRAREAEERAARDCAELIEKGAMPAGWARVLYPWSEVLSRLEGLPLVAADTFSAARPPVEIRTTVDFSLRAYGGYSGIDDLCEELSGCFRAGCAVILPVPDGERAQKLSAALREKDIIAPISGVMPPKGGAAIAVGELTGGVIYPDAGLAVLGPALPRAARARRPAAARNAKNRINSYNDLDRGDYVVHQKHGIGIFTGIRKMEINGVAKDYIEVRYAGEDRLYIPCNQLDMLTRYVAPGEKKVRLSRMGGSDWTRTRERVKTAVRKLAADLIALYAERSRIKGHAFGPDDSLQEDFESLFPYEETEDQLRCTREIKDDMERPVPMDRLLCGDVGFGKTEVAMRAIFKCVSGGKQAAVLVPTTLLARQHLSTMTERFSGYPVEIEMLSRFRTAAQQKRVVERLKAGRVDIVVGTHRLLQRDVAFRDLGLLVVDEEQRFGVGDKERLKELTKNVDCLTLTATPIPRTLNMAISGIRDMSLIEEPPAGRSPVTTYVCEYDLRTVADAIRREMRRGGQCYYLCPRIDAIARTAAAIKEAVPEAQVMTAHGRMNEAEMSDVMGRFIDGEGDVLICTTIIETGIDIPNVNTLIIERADLLGLAQLYQIRGRVGRSERRASAYLMYRAEKALTEEAVKRLTAIKEFTEFGSGFKIALRDLEIRGAGSILGAEQHGHMESVGYDTYVRLLSEAVADESGVPAETKTECSVDIAIDAYIPAEFMESGAARIDMYRRIASVADGEDALDVRDEIIDRFGDIPQSVENLIQVALLRNRAGADRISEITQRGDTVRFVADDMQGEAVGALTKALGRRLKFFTGKKSGFDVALKKDMTVMDCVNEALDILEGAGKNK